MSTIDQKAQEIADKLAKKHKVAFDPLTILTIISILISLARFIQECMKDKALRYNRIRSPGLFGRKYVKKLIVQYTKKVKKENNFNVELETEFYALGGRLTRLEADSIFEEALKRELPKLD